MMPLVVSWLYLIYIGIVEYIVIFLFLPGWNLTLDAKLQLIYMGFTALGILAGVIGLGKGKSWAVKTILSITSLNLIYGFYGLWTNVIMEGVEYYKYNHTFGQAPASLIYTVPFIAFNIYFFRLAWRRRIL
jgi:hypothetical protein